MKITKKILENLIKEEVDKALLSEDMMKIMPTIEAIVADNRIKSAIITLADLLAKNSDHIIRLRNRIDELERK